MPVLRVQVASGRAAGVRLAEDCPPVMAVFGWRMGAAAGAGRITRVPLPARPCVWRGCGQAGIWSSDGWLAFPRGGADFRAMMLARSCWRRAGARVGWGWC